MRGCEGHGGTVDLEFLDLEGKEFRLNGMEITQHSVADHSVRPLLESIAIVTAEVQGLMVLNHARENVARHDFNELAKRAGAKRLMELAQRLQEVGK